MKNICSGFGIIFAVFLFHAGDAVGAVGEAGCGPGSVVFTKNTFVSQTLAQGLNAISSPFHFAAIYTGSSNCTATWAYFKPVEQERMQFIADNFWNLQIELAKGQGDSLTALADLHDCSPSMHSHVLKISREITSKRFDPEIIAKQSVKLTILCQTGDRT